MSAFMVDKVHIDALVTAGVAWGAPHIHDGPIRWTWPELSEEDEHDAYERGEPWGPRAIELYRQRMHELTRDQAGRVGAMLWAENRRSIDHRYNEEELEDPYEFTALPGHPDPVVVLAAIGCYEYQSCEHPDWHRSEAYAFIQSLRARAIRKVIGDNPTWEITDPQVFMKAAAARRQTA